MSKFNTAEVLKVYDILEPGETDTWNPVCNDYELAYRLSLFYSLTKSLRLSYIPLKSLKVLDVGCGNGRSTRMYLDLGLEASQLVGIDIREGTIKLAKKLNPAINFMSYEGNFIPFPDQSFNWLQVAGVFSSIKTPENRDNLARELYQKIQPGGYLFYYDLCRDIYFDGDGCNLILPSKLFSGFPFKEIWHSRIRRFSFIPKSHQIINLIQSLWKRDAEQIYKNLRMGLGGLIRPSHEVLLIQKLS
ncbi:MAG: class I SAM-dependent methyltransferase [Fischerella sp.]|nr:class I SAM-dependent methyltransferase [Fischerella sp.]